MSTPTVSTAVHPVNGSRKVAELTWDQVFDGIPAASPARQAWRDAIDQVAAKAKAALPDANGRIAAAVKIVLAGDVELLPDGTAKVASQSNGTTKYSVVNGVCDCPDAKKAPAGFCTHRLAYGMHKRAKQLTAQQLQAREAPAQTTHQEPQDATIVIQDDGPVIPPSHGSHTEAPASANTYLSLQGYRVQLTLRGVNEQEVLARLMTVLAQYPLPNDAQTHQALPEGWCRRHDVQMTRQSNDKGAWWSHQVDGIWCKGK